MAIYLDYNASTPLAPEVVEAMRPYWWRDWGNPSAGHWAAVPAKAALERARGEVAGLLGAAPDEIVFSSGATESNNHAIKSVVLAAQRRGRGHVVTTAVEHPSVLEPCRWLAGLGAELTVVPVDRHGRVDPAELCAALRDDTVLVSVMHGQNEVGTVQPIAAIAAGLRGHGALLHCDAAQTAGKIAVDVRALGVDLLTLAGHKLYAPKGVGALYLRRGLELEPLLHGAGHEAGRRSGTENVLFAVGLGAACALAAAHPCGDRLAELSDYFWQRLQERFGARVIRNGHPSARLPNTVHVSFPGHAGGDLLAKLPGVAASTGAGCKGGKTSVSAVLTAMGTSESHALGAIRFSLGRGTRREELDRVVAGLAGALE